MRLRQCPLKSNPCDGVFKYFSRAHNRGLRFFSSFNDNRCVFVIFKDAPTGKIIISFRIINCPPTLLLGAAVNLPEFHFVRIPRSNSAEPARREAIADEDRATGNHAPTTCYYNINNESARAVYRENPRVPIQRRDRTSQHGLGIIPGAAEVK